MKKAFILFFLLFFSHNLLIARDSDEMQTEYDFRQEYHFRPGVQTGSNQVINKLLQIIADGNNKLRVFVHYTFQGSLDVRVKLPDSQTAGIAVNITNQSLSGEYTYRHFDISHWLIPSLLDVKVHITDGSGNILQDIHLTGIKWNDQENSDTLLTYDLNGFSPVEDMHIHITSVDFYYPSEYFEEATFLRNALSSYYEAPNQIEKARTLIDGLSIDKPEQLIIDEFRLCDAEIIAGKLRFESFHDIINYEGKDPLNVLDSLEVLHHELLALRPDFNFAISHIDSILYDRGIQLLKNGETENARANFERAVSYNRWYIPAQLALAIIELYSDSAPDALNRMTDLMGKVSPPVRWHEDIQLFALELFTLELKRAEKLALDDRFLDALKILNRLDEFCKATENTWDCPNELFISMGNAHYGMYRSFLRVAERAYVSGNFSFAVTYIENAREYQQQNQVFIEDDQESMLLMQQVSEAYQLRAEEALSYYDFDDALKKYEALRDLCSAYPSLDCPDDLEARISETKEKKEQALLFTAEFDITEPGVIAPETNLEMIRENVKEQLSLGHLKAWAGEISEAGEILNRVAGYAMRYDLRKDTIINLRIISLSEMIRRKECELQEREIKKLAELIPEKVEAGHYNAAFDDYTQLKNMIKSEKDCEWTIAENLVEKFSYTSLLSDYEQQLHIAQGAYFRGAQEGFIEFLELYSRADDFFIENNLSQYNLDHQLLSDFISQSSNISFMKAGVKFFAGSNQHENALELLKLIKLNRLDAREVKELQEYAGKLAAIDFSIQSTEGQPSKYVREITENDSWFRFYVKSFLNNL
ncbi:MAG: hypothetical protein ABR597_05530 [Bacteroidales bacterium]